MGFLRKTVKKIGRGIKKLGKKIGKAFKKIIKPFAKVFGKLGPLGSIAMMMILPGLGQMLAGFGAGAVTNTLGQFAGQVVKFTGNAINFVASAPQKIFKTITGALSNGWNALMGNSAQAQGTFLSGTGQYVDTTGMVGKEAILAETGNAAAPNSWWQSFTNDVKNIWGNRGVTTADNLFVTDATGAVKGQGNFWDASAIGDMRLESFKGDVSQMGTDIKNVFEGDKRIAITEKAAETKFANDPKALQTFIDTGQTTFKGDVYRLDREGLFGNIADAVGGTTGRVMDITVPGAGKVGDIANVGSMTLGAYNAYSSINPQELELAGGSGAGIFAEEQLYSGDQGGLYNTTSPTWSYNPNMSVIQNQQNAANVWNSTYGLPQGFDPFATPGYGLSYEQWLQQSMAA